MPPDSQGIALGCHFAVSTEFCSTGKNCEEPSVVQQDLWLLSSGFVFWFCFLVLVKINVNHDGGWILYNVTLG